MKNHKIDRQKCLNTPTAFLSFSKEVLGLHSVTYNVAISQ